MQDLKQRIANYEVIYETVQAWFKSSRLPFLVHFGAVRSTIVAKMKLHKPFAVHFLAAEDSEGAFIKLFNLSSKVPFARARRETSIEEWLKGWLSC